MNIFNDIKRVFAISFRAIEIHVESRIKKKTPASEFSYVDIQDINKAVSEYKENPLMIRTKNACAIEKAIIIAMCKHSKITGAAEISLETIWNRFCDFVAADEGINKERQKANMEASSDLNIPGDINEYSEGSLKLPPYHVFESSVQRLCDQGVLVMHRPKTYLKAGFGAKACLLYDCTFSTQLTVSDIEVALRNHKYLHFL